METEKITFIKKNAVIPINIGASFISRLQQAMIFLTEDKTDEEVELFKKSLETRSPLEGWMLHTETLALLIKEIEDSALNGGFTVEQEVPNS